MRGDEPVRGIAVAMLAPALGEHVLLLRLQHRKLSDFFEVARQSAMRAYTRQTPSGHEKPVSSGQAAALFPTNRPPATLLYKTFVTWIKACGPFTVP
jgi:hypothetical protein